MREALEMLGGLTGKKVPRFRIPYAVALCAAYWGEATSVLSGKPPRAPLAGVKMARYEMYFDATKAVKELGLPQTEAKKAFADAISWFAESGYLN